MKQLRLLVGLCALFSVSVAQAQQTPTQTIVRDGSGDTIQQNVSNGNAHVNVGRINDVVPLMGAGTTGTGSPRVTEASDSQLSQGVGATGDAAATAGGTGSINAKLRLLTDLVNQVLTELGQKTEPANTQAISAASLPLPTGAATAANQDGIIKDGTGDTTQANVVGGRLQVENYNANLAADNSTNSTSKVPVIPCVATAAAPSYTEGRQVPCSSDLSGNRRVTCANCSGSGATHVDDAAFTGATDDVAPMGALYDTTPPTITDGRVGVPRMNSNRQLFTEVVVLPALPTGTNSIGQVTANAGTNLNTSALLTTSAHDAAFGTAGSPDAQVRSIQGIASGTPVGVQSNGANLATEASVDGLEGGIGAAADAAATAGSTGSINAKLRLMSSQLDAIQTAIQLIDDDQTGASVHYRTSAGSTEDEHEVKGSAGRLFSITATNTNAAARYLRCANQVIGSTTPGTTTVFLGLAIPGATTGAGFTTNFGPTGIAFSTGLTCWLVTGAADSDVAEVAANEIKVIYTYK